MSQLSELNHESGSAPAAAAQQLRLYWERVREGALAPQQMHAGDAGFDLATAVDLWIWPGQTLAVPTGLRFIIPEGYELQVRPRSGLSLRTSLRIVNSPGTIDAGFRDEVRVLLGHSGQHLRTLGPRGEDQAWLAPELLALEDEAWESKERSFDEDYLARCCACLSRLGLAPASLESPERWPKPYFIPRGTRIAQAVPMALPGLTWKELSHEAREEAERQSVRDRQGGFGSSGLQKNVKEAGEAPIQLRQEEARSE